MTENQAKIAEYRKQGYAIEITSDGYMVDNPKGKHLAGASVMLPRRKPLHWRHRQGNLENNMRSVIAHIERSIALDNHEEYERLTKKQKKIYDSVMESFPATKHDRAYEVALQGGVRWQFQFK